MKYLLFLVVTFNVLIAQNLVKNSSYVIDKENSLFWQDKLVNVNIRKSHDEAIKYCKDLRLGEYDNWKLPTVKQYKTIINKENEIAIKKQFKYILPVDYWTIDTRWQSLNRYAYYIFFKSGSVYYNNKSQLKFVRCVREIKN